MVDVLVLLDVHFLVFNQNNRTLITVLPTIVRCAEHCNDRGERLLTGPPMHFVPVNLDLVRSYYGDIVISLQQLLHWLQTEFD